MNISYFFVRTVLTFGLFIFSGTAVFAADTIIPASIDVPLQPEKSFSLDILYSSGEGGTYDLAIKQFDFNREGQKVFRDDPGFMTLSESFLEFSPGESKIFVLSGEAPADLKDGDYYYSVHVTKRQSDPTLFYTTNLVSLIYVKVGEVDHYGVEVTDLKVQRREDGKIDTLTFLFTDTATRYFLVYPQIVLLGQNEEVVDYLKGEPLKAFPGIPRNGNFVYFSDQDYVVPDGLKANFQLLNEHGAILYQQELNDVRPGDIFLTKKPPQAMTDQKLLLRVRQDFVWTDWVLRIVMIAVGLSLIGYFFYNRR